jgi:hypothetical protein
MTDAIATEQTLTPVEMSSRQVVYLFGAGASHGCAKFRSSRTGILMRDLALDISEKVRKLATDEFKGNASITRLVNDVIREETEIEQVITFLEESGSRIHQDFARALRDVFRSVLAQRLSTIATELTAMRSQLYASVIDMHLVEKFEEKLSGILTLNYDDLIEHAIQEVLGLRVDYGIGQASRTADSIRLLKLHGSFNWEEAWPINKRDVAATTPFWIPPGIQKEKARYPFSVLWGMAREMLDCDVLRIVGCRLTANDWDLVSMLFATQHVHSRRIPYDIEIIDTLETADRIKTNFPYLGARSLVELRDVGPRMISELIGGDPRPYNDLSDSDKGKLKKAAAENVPNPFEYWLRLKAEIMFEDLDSIATPKGIIENFVGSH